MIAGLYGFDEVFEYCWYEAHIIPDKTVLLRVVLTYDVWICIPLLHLIVAVAFITCSLFSPRGLFSGIGTSRYLTQHPSHAHSASSTNVTASLAATLARRNTARRALTIRVLGYIIVPIICVVPRVAVGIIARARLHIKIPSVVVLVATMRTFIAILLSLDPSVVAMVFARHIQKRRKTRRRKCVPSWNARVLGGDIEMRDSKPIGPSKGPRMVEIHSI